MNAAAVLPLFARESSRRICACAAMAAFLLAVAPPATAALVELEKGNISFNAPDDFTPMTPDELVVRYPFPENTLEAIASPDRSATISYTLAPTAVLPGQLNTLRGVMTARLTKMTPTLQWIKKEILTINGTSWAYFEYVSGEADGSVRTMLIATPYRGLLFIMRFNVREEDFDTYSHALVAAMESTQLRDFAMPPDPPAAQLSLTADEEIIRAELAAQEQNYDLARKNARSALALQPGMPQATFLLGQIETDEGHYDKARDDFSAALAANPKFEPALERRAAVEAQLGDFAAALKDANQATTWRPGAASFFTRGFVEATESNFTEAEIDYTHALALQPSFFRAKDERAWVKFCRGDLNAATNDYKAVLAVQAGPTTVYGLACIAVASSQLSIAQINLQNVVDGRKTPGVGDSHVLLWVVKAETGQAAAATAELNDYLQDDSLPKRDWVKNIGAYLTGQKSESELLATADTTNSFRHKVDECRIWYFIGMKRKLAGDTRGANAAFRKCVDTNLRSWEYFVFAYVELARSNPAYRFAHEMGRYTVWILIVAILGSFVVFGATLLGLVLYLVLRPSPAGRSTGAPIQKPPPMR
jgi:lipoprotein NlpI